MRGLMALLLASFVLTCAGATPVAAQDMPLSQVLIDGQGWELVADGFQFTEGPAADDAGNVYFTDVRSSKIYRIDAVTGKVSEFVAESDRTNGLMFGPGNQLYGCCGGKQQIVKISPQGQFTTLAENASCNDLAVRANGGVYYTDPVNKKVWYITPLGEKHVVDLGIDRPNGVILWPDGGTLVVADTLGPHLWTFRVEPNGALAHKQPYYTLRMTPGQTGSGADGMTVDTDGRLYVATHAGLQVFDPTGRMSGVILKPQNKFLSNATFGGPKFDWLYVTCSDGVYRRPTKVQGVRFKKSEPNQNPAAP